MASERVPWTQRVVSVAFLLVPLAALAGAGPFKLESERTGAQVRSVAKVSYRGRDVALEQRNGEVAARGLLLDSPAGAAAVVLWLEGTAGKQGRVAVYSLPAGLLTTQSAWYSRVGLEAWGADGFAVSTPLDRLGLSPPWLRVERRFKLAGGSLASAGTEKAQPSTPDQTLEWCSDELENGDAKAALEKLEAYRVEFEPQLAGQPEMALCLRMLGRAQVKLGLKTELRTTLEKLAAHYPSTPEGPWAEEALRFIEANGIEKYLERERR